MHESHTCIVSCHHESHHDHHTPAEKIVLSRVELAESVPVLSVFKDDAVGNHPHEPLVLEETEEGVRGGIRGERLASHYPTSSKALGQKLLNVQSQFNLYVLKRENRQHYKFE